MKFWIRTSIFLFLLLVICSIKSPFPTRADELSDIENKLKDLNHQLELSISATNPLEKNLVQLEAQLADIKNRIGLIQNEVVRKEKEVKEGESLLSEQQVVLGRKVREYYKNNIQFSSYTLQLLLGKNLDSFIRDFGYQKKVVNTDRDAIVKVVMYIGSLEEKKRQLENEKGRLAKIQVETDKQAGFLDKEVKNAKAYQVQLSGQIATLTARQQELLAAKTGTFSTTVGDVPLADDPASRPDYNPGFSPAFAVFSFGAPHRKGMSQYGAFGRSKQGQSYEEILKHYYGDIRLEGKDVPDKIKTDQGEKSFEDDYLKGIAEMPSSWADEGGYEALKAQAIAARTYALAYVGWGGGGGTPGGTICTSESCQVYTTGKRDNPAAAKWHQAVSDTRGKVMVSNKSGNVFSAWYASTSGGYTKGNTSNGHDVPSSWDTKCGNQGCWTADAYEKISGSPWFYKSWYKTRSGNSCGRSSPWLTQDEFTDIINAALIVKNDSGSSSHLSQTDGCLGQVPETWDKNKVREEVAKFGGPVSAVTSVSVAYSTDGDTASVTVNTDKGIFSFDGSSFKQAFNLRAPAVVYIASSLFSVERK